MDGRRLRAGRRPRPLPCVGTQTAVEVCAGHARSARGGRAGRGCLPSASIVSDPERLTSLMIAAFAGKMVFFGAYVAVMLKVLSLRPVPFVVSFTSSFIALYLMEALVSAASVRRRRRTRPGSGCSRPTDDDARSRARTGARPPGRTSSSTPARSSSSTCRTADSIIRCIHLPRVLGIDFSVTKHVLMLWLVAAFVFVVVTWTVRRYLRQDRLIPSGFMNALEVARRVRARLDRAAQRRHASG